MKSIQEYRNSNSNYFNSLHASLTDSVLIGENLLIKRGKEIDSIFHKLNIYEWRQTHGSYIHESYKNVEFTIDEQFAARDMFINIAESYAQQLCDDFCEEYNIDEAFNWKEPWNKTKEFFVNAADNVKDAYNELKGKLKEVAEFIKEVTSKAIKSAKEMVDKFINMMLKIKQGIGELLEKFGGDLKEIQEEIKNAVADAINKKGKGTKENIYETLGNSIANGEPIDEGLFNIFKRKKDKDSDKDAAKDNNSNDKSTDKKSDEYEDAQKAKPGNKVKTKGGWKSVVLGMLKQIAISVIVLVIVPAIIGCAWGPAAAMIAATIAKFALSGYAAIKLIRDIKKTISEGAWSKMTKWQKAFRVVMWIVSAGLIAWGSTKAFEDAGTIIKAFQENTLNQLLPDGAVQGAMKIINNIWKALTGENTKGYEEMMNVINGGLVKLDEIKVEVKSEGGEVGQDVKELAKEFDAQNFKSSTQAWDWLKSKGISMDKIPSDASLNVVLDGSQHASHAKKLIEFLTSNGWEGNVGDGFNAGLNGLNNMAGSVFTLDNVPAELLQKAADAGIQLGHNGLYSIVGAATQATTSTITQTITTSLPAIVGGFAPVIAMPKIVNEFVKGPFKLRMGSSRSGYDIYTIQEGDKGIKTMTFSDAEKELGKLNPTLFDKMKASINKNYASLEKAKKELEGKKKLTKEERKLEKAITKSLEKIKDGVTEFECAIFYSDKVIETEEVKEGLFEAKNEKDVKYKPVVIYCPFIMGWGDLTGQRNTTKPPRKSVLQFKGLFSRYEFLPMDNGMSEQEIIEMLIEFAFAGVSAAYDCCIDSPCVKEGKKLVVNKNCKVTGARDDFGGFTNEEITEILNTKGDAAAKYFGGKFAKGASTVEKENTESQKQRKENAKKEWKENIENNDDIKELINKSKTLKKYLLDDDGNVKPEALDELSDTFLRVETSYLRKKKEKKGFFAKIKDFFSGKKKDDKENTEGIDKYDKDELQELSYKLASLHKEKLNKKAEKNEGLSTDEYHEIYERLFMLNANMKLFESEFGDYLEYGDTIFESTEDEETTIEFTED